MPRLSFPEAVKALEGTDKFFVNDIGVETELIYKKDVDLPCFAAFALLKTERGRVVIQLTFFAPESPLKIAPQRAQSSGNYLGAS